MAWKYSNTLDTGTEVVEGKKYVTPRECENDLKSILGIGAKLIVGVPIRDLPTNKMPYDKKNISEDISELVMDSEDGKYSCSTAGDNTVEGLVKMLAICKRSGGVEYEVIEVGRLKLIE
jgi:hypothetical protein